MTETMIRATQGNWLAPVLDPITGTLLDAANVSDGIPRQDTGNLFETYACINTDYVATLPCPANTLAAPVDTAGSTATTGGSLPATTTFRAKITAINTRGETIASGERSVTTGAGSTNTVTFNWNAVSGATGYRVYVTNGGANSEANYVQVGAVTTYVMTAYLPAGSVAASPPTVNTAVVPVTKNFDGPSWQSAIRFAVQAGVICKMVGWDTTNAEQQLERVFNNKESFAVARALMQNRFVVNGSAWAAATDLTPAGGAVNPDVGLAMLEEDAGLNYAGKPLIHVPRSIGSLLTRNGQTHLEGSTLVSEFGTPIAADPGYGQAYKTAGTDVNNGPAGTVPAAGELWIYASGEVSVQRGEAVQKGGPDLVETTDSNRYRMLRERLYVATVDCYTAAVRVKVL